jgi:hypothetical protein
MRLVALLALTVLLAACGSATHHSRVFNGHAAQGDAPAGTKAGGAASLAIANSRVVAKGLLVVHAGKGRLVVRRPTGDTLPVRYRSANARPGERVSFTGTLRGGVVLAKTLSIAR